MNGDKLSYQHMLRALGAYLDQQSGRRVRLMELPDGFALRYQRPLRGRSPIFKQFKYEELSASHAELERSRHSRRHQTNRSNRCYSDLLRAIGHELDETSARDVLVDEQEDGTLVRYLHVHLPAPHLSQERKATLGPDERQAILADAYARRQEPARMAG